MWSGCGKMRSAVQSATYSRLHRPGADGRKIIFQFRHDQLFRCHRFGQQHGCCWSTLATQTPSTFFSFFAGNNNIQNYSVYLYNNRDPSVSISCDTTAICTSYPRSLSRNQHQLQQVRWKGRNDGNRYSVNNRRPTTKKARKVYHRHLRKLEGEKNKHGKPGSKAETRRAWASQMKQELIDQSDEKSDSNEVSLLGKGGAIDSLEDQYGMADALLDDLIGNTSYLSSTPTPEPIYLGHKYQRYYNRVAEKMEIYRESMAKLAASTQTRLENEQKDLLGQETRDGETPAVEAAPPQLPSDYDISVALRSFRDKKASRSRPVGIVAALQLLIQDLGLPINAFGELTYTTLLTCCRTTQEARRVFQMMEQQNIPITEYSWSILVDIHARIGDFHGCANVQVEMLQEGGIAPTLASYTSLLAACYKVSVDGRVAHKIRADAAQIGWNKWKEMRIVGLNPDVMAYGAILRLTAATGQPEKALNLLQEMQQLQIKPTTLCFTSALRAIARSQSTAIRFEKGFSKKNRRREFITHHHGKMARTVTIMAENAEVELDDGFIAALALCAAEAGDVATAKAIYAASQIRKLDQFRTIGPDSHLARLRGETSEEIVLPDLGRLVSNTGKENLFLGSENGNDRNFPMTLKTNASYSLNLEQPGDIQKKKMEQSHLTYGEREYGKDNRVLSAILHACARAVDKNGIGTMWQGRENEGYLCENSLRLLMARRIPRFTPSKIPGQKHTDNLTWDGEKYMDRGDYRPGKRMKNKFRGVYGDDASAATLDDLDEAYAKIYMDDDGRLKKQFQPTTPEDIWWMKYGIDGRINGYRDTAALHLEKGKDSKALINGIECGSAPVTFPLLTEESSDDQKNNEELYFDYDSMRWKTRSEGLNEDRIGEKHRGPTLVNSCKMEADTNRKDLDTLDCEVNINDESHFKHPGPVSGQKSVPFSQSGLRDDTILYFDTSDMQWKSKSKHETKEDKMTSYEADSLLNKSDTKQKSQASTHISQNNEKTEDFNESGFEMFFADLRTELQQSGEADDVTEEEARELFIMMREEYLEMIGMEEGPNDLLSSGIALDSTLFGEQSLENQSMLSVMHNISSENISPPKMLKSSQSDSDSEVKGKGYGMDKEGTVLEDNVVDLSHNRSINYCTNSNNNRLGYTVHSTSKEFDSTLFNEDKTEIWDQSKCDKPHELPVLHSPLTLGNEPDSEYSDARLEELRQYLPLFSDNRLRQTLETFTNSLGNPPLLELVRVARERMPDYVTATWLKQMSSLTAKYVVQKAAQEGYLDLYILNGALELQTSCGSLDSAVEFYEKRFEEYGMIPTEYSDRLVLQMFLRNNRPQRALAFKHTVESRGRKLGIKAYGSLIEYFAHHHQVGSAMLLLRECLSVHRAPPGEASLSNLRMLCRKAKIIDKVGLNELIGMDPVEWIRHGEAKLKREMSKKGRRDVQMARNQLVRI